MLLRRFGPENFIFRGNNLFLGPIFSLCIIDFISIVADSCDSVYNEENILSLLCVIANGIGKFCLKYE